MRLLIFMLMLMGCGTTSKKLKNLSPLSKNAPVQIFWSHPDLKYEAVCDIEALGNTTLGGYDKKEDFKKMLKAEARRCGANGVLFILYSRLGNKASVIARGIRITGQPTQLKKDAFKALIIAIQSRDIKTVKKIVKNVLLKSSERSPSDDMAINSALYVATLEGLSCHKKIVNLLEKEYGGYITKINTISNLNQTRSYLKAPLCNDVLARSFSKIHDKLKVIQQVNDFYIQLISSRDKQLNLKAKRYHKLLVVISNFINNTCQKSQTDPVCAIKGSFIDIANKSKKAPSPNIRKNAQTLLKILVSNSSSK